MNSHVYEPRVSRRTIRHKIRGIDYAVSEWGDPADPLMVYLHGWGDCGATLQFVIDHFERDWFVVAPDFRGFGGTVTESSAYWFPDYLADVDRLLDIYAADTSVRLVGHSMGGNVAGLLAGSTPQRVRAFVNIEGFGLPDSDPEQAPARYRQWLQTGRSSLAFAAYTSYSALAERLQKRSPRMHSAQAEFVARCWAKERDGQICLRADPLHKLPNAVLYRRAESEACWRNVTADVLLIAGSESEFGRQRDAGSAHGGASLPFPSVTTATIADSGHMLHFEAPAALADVIEEFLTALPEVS